MPMHAQGQVMLMLIRCAVVRVDSGVSRALPVWKFRSSKTKVLGTASVYGVPEEASQIVVERTLTHLQ